MFHTRNKVPTFPAEKKKKNERNDFADENPGGRVREGDEQARTDMHTRVVVSAARFLSFSFCSRCCLKDDCSRFPFSFLTIF
jgi:hypothetical protein